jgi:hypothetical protein
MCCEPSHHVLQNGKEETGVALSAYMLYAQLASAASDAARLFVGRRLIVAQPLLSVSQLRSVLDYFLLLLIDVAAATSRISERLSVEPRRTSSLCALTSW